ncbi:MAG: hypothetical protein H6679_05520 [Epsilonproteobacteria bacterium]|nr:hypothetical protein [Campylobacterota bacterium]
MKELSVIEKSKNVLIIGFFATFFTIATTFILSYISIATMVGPWFAPTIVLVCAMLLREHTKNHANAFLIQAISAGGGIIATGVGFTLPMLYFLEPELFSTWLQEPLSFCGFLSLLTFSAGLIGLFLGKTFSHKLLTNQALRFPVSQVIYQTAVAQDQPKQGAMLGLGGGLTLVASLLKDGLGSIQGVLPSSIPLIPFVTARWAASFTIPLWPGMWATGFIIGASCIVPLIVGIATKQAISYTLTTYSLINLKPESFMIAFCGGMLCADMILSNLKGLKKLLTKPSILTGPKQALGKTYRKLTSAFVDLRMLKALLSFLPASLLLTHFQFSVLAQLTLFALTALSCYHICFLGCQIGLLQFGRFSTFVLIPMFLIFKLNFLQATIICVFFNVCAAAAADLLFDFKIGAMSSIKQKKMEYAQLIGLLLTSLSIGAILWFIFTHLPLGSAHLFAQRGQAKALLIQTFQFDPLVMTLGALFAIALKFGRVSAMMVFSGIVMPVHMSLGIIAGSLASKIFPNQQAGLPFCAGIFTAESLWILLRILCV